MRRYIQFLLSRLLGTGVDTLVMWLCSDFIFFGSYVGQNIISPTISFEFAVMSNFLCSYYWIWSSRIENKTRKSFIKHFIAFNIASLSGFLLKMLFLLLFQRIFGWDVIVCNLAALCISGFFNFFIEKLVIFRKRKERPEHELLNTAELANIAPIFRGYWGSLMAKIVIAICDVNKLNILYDQVYFERGKQCVDKLLRLMHSDYLMGHHHRLDNLPDGPFIVISNQPYGAFDGIVMMDMIGNVRSDFKLLASEMMARIEPLRDNFVFRHACAEGEEVDNMEEAEELLKAGGALGIFPSARGAKYRMSVRRVVDSDWNIHLIKFVQQAQVPIVPIRFLDRNSRFYYGLGIISFPLRLLRLPSEFFNKGRGQHRVVVGETITVEQQLQYPDIDKYHMLLRDAVYGIDLPETFVRRSEIMGEE